MKTEDYVTMLLRAMGPCSLARIEQEIIIQDPSSCSADYKSKAAVAIAALLQSGKIAMVDLEDEAYDMVY
jgi:hypothetical protein